MDPDSGLQIVGQQVANGMIHVVEANDNLLWNTMVHFRLAFDNKRWGGGGAEPLTFELKRLCNLEVERMLTGKAFTRLLCMKGPEMVQEVEETNCKTLLGRVANVPNRPAVIFERKSLEVEDDSRETH